MINLVSSLHPANRAEWIGVAAFAVTLLVGMVVMAGWDPNLWVYLDPETYRGAERLSVFSVFSGLVLASVGFVFALTLFEGDSDGTPLPFAILLAVVGGLLGWLVVGWAVFKFAEFWVYAQMPRALMLAFWAAAPALTVSVLAMRFFGPKGSRARMARSGRLLDSRKEKFYPGLDGVIKAAGGLALLLATLLFCRGALAPFGVYFLESFTKVL